VDSHADVTLRADMWLSGVKAHPHPDFDVPRSGELRQRDLSVYRGRDRCSRTLDRDEESVAGRVDFPSAVCRDRLAQEPVVVGPHFGEGLLTRCRKWTVESSMSLKRNVTVLCGSDARLLSLIMGILSYLRSTRKSQAGGRSRGVSVLDAS
jgi:hypothetical protein